MSNKRFSLKRELTKLNKFVEGKKIRVYAEQQYKYEPIDNTYEDVKISTPKSGYLSVDKDIIFGDLIGIVYKDNKAIMDIKTSIEPNDIIKMTIEILGEVKYIKIKENHLELLMSQMKPLKYSKEFEMDGYKKIYKDVKMVDITNMDEYISSDRYVVQSEITFKDETKEVEKILDNFGNKMEYIKDFDNKGRVIRMRNNIYARYIEVNYTYEGDRLIREESKDFYIADYIYYDDHVDKIVKNLATGVETVITTQL